MIMRCAVPRIFNTMVKIENIPSLIIKLFTNQIKIRPRILIHKSGVLYYHIESTHFVASKPDPSRFQVKYLDMLADKKYTHYEMTSM